MHRSTLAASAVTLVAGLAIGGAAHADPKPKVVTRTVTKTVDHDVVRTVDRKVTEVPKSCLSALKAARAGFTVAGRAFDAASKYPPLIGDAYKAGVLGTDAQDVLDKMQSATSALQGAAADLDPDAFTTAAAACEQAAQ